MQGKAPIPGHPNYQFLQVLQLTLLGASKTQEAAQVGTLKPVSSAAQRAIEALIPLPVCPSQASPHSWEEENYRQKAGAASICFWGIRMGVFISIPQVLLSTNDRVNDLRLTW